MEQPIHPGLQEPLLQRSTNDEKAFHDETSPQQAGRENPNGCTLSESYKTGGCMRRAARILLLGIMWALFVAWITFFILYPTTFLRQHVLERLNKIAKASFFGTYGTSLLLFSVPILMIALLGSIYLGIDSHGPGRRSTKKNPRVGLWTNPALVHGLLGVVSVAELILIVLVLLYVVWFLWNYISRDFSMVDHFDGMSPARRWRFKLELVGVRTGVLGLLLLGFLFLPVSRGSVLLRLIDIPFEHAVKYHVWLGHLMMFIFTFHGLAYVVTWASEGRLMSELFSWQPFEVAILPGVISLVSGLMMWVTSLELVRQRFFELFFYTHQLYVIFIIFMALHAGDFLLGFATAGIFLFLLDRFLRFCQSRRAVAVTFARTLPCNSLELVLAKPPSLKYNSLSFIFLNVPGLSWLQWHPFSVSSSPFDGHNHLAILIKPLGSWTRKLKEIVAITEQQSRRKENCLSKMVVCAEGPYGHESDYYLRYDNLILVAGGIGVSPFVAVIRDLLHRHQMNEANIPRSVLLIWAVKKSKELYVLDLVHPMSICPNYTEKLDIDVRAYVTQEFHGNFEGNVLRETVSDSDILKKPMSVLVGTSSNFWFGMCLLWCILGYSFISYLITVYGVYPYETQPHTVIPFWQHGGYVALSMILAVIIFGGILAALWTSYGEKFWMKRKGSDSLEEEKKPLADFLKENFDAMESGVTRLLQPYNVQYGRRPDFQELFEETSTHWEGSNVGVLVCGPQSIQTSVAAQCRIYNCMKFSDKRVAFHYHSLSFDL